MFLTLAAIEWGSVIVAVVILALIGAIMIVTVVRDNPGGDAGIKMWGALGTLSGFVIGTMGTYFFTQGQVETKNAQIQTVETQLAASERDKVEAGRQIETLVENIRPAAVSQGHADVIGKLEYVGKSLKDTSSLALFRENPTASPAPSVWASPHD